MSDSATVREALFAALSAGEPAEGQPVRVEALALRGDHVMSRIFAAREEGTQRPLIVKAVKAREGGAGYLEREWKVLCALGEARAAGRLPPHVAPKAIALLDDPPAIVMEEAPGVRLDHRMSASVGFPQRFFRFGGLVRTYAAATECLAAIATVLVDGPPAIRTEPMPLARLAENQRSAGAWEKSLADNVLSLASDLGVAPPANGFKHGNFAPWNVLVGPAGITVLDFQEAEQPGNWLDDVAQMILHLEIAGAAGGLRATQVPVLVRAIQSAAVAVSGAARGGQDLRARYLSEMCRLHSWYTGAAAEDLRESLRPRAGFVAALLRRFVASGGTELPWR